MIYREDLADGQGNLLRIDEYDTTTHTVTTTINNEPPETRPMTADEIAYYNNYVTELTAMDNTTQMIEESSTAVDKLVAVVEALNLLTAKTNSEINANPAAIIKDLARECKTIARQANREARLTSGRTESTNTGTEVAE